MLLQENEIRTCTLPASVLFNNGPVCIYVYGTQRTKHDIKLRVYKNKYAQSLEITRTC